MLAPASRVPLIATGAVLLLTAALLGTDRLEYCGQPAAFRPCTEAALAVDSPAPTLAPPQKVVFIHIEADKSGLEIGWMDY
jgi:hypothetical protein